jgi:uncharacterized membrane protein (DUF2068 family)
VSSSEQTRPHPPTASPAQTPRPGRLTAAGVLCGLEALALAVAGVYLLVMGLAGEPDSPQQAVTGGITVLVLGVIPLLAARGLLLRRRWSRGPALVTQIIALPVAWTLSGSGGVMTPVGIAIAVVAVTGLVLLVNRATTEALGIRAPGRDV